MIFSLEKFIASFPQLGRDDPKLLERARQQLLTSFMNESRVN